MQKEKGFWIGLSLLNLALVAFFGLLMRTKIIFSIPFLDYRNLLHAHSHYAFGGWVGLALIALLILELLPQQLAQKKIYRTILWGIQVSAVGMGLSFLFMGYNAVSIFFTALYILTTYVFGWVYFKDLRTAAVNPVVRWLGLGSVASLLLSAIGTLGLLSILLTKSGNSLLYRDFNYAFLHLQYNGFFTLGIFALFFSYWLKKEKHLPPAAGKFSLLLLASILPTLFLALLWHNLVVFYAVAAVGCILILVSVVYFVPVFRESLNKGFFSHPLAKALWVASFVSFLLKMVLTIGTLYPPLGHAVYGARPVIIGFLHLVFLAFVSFFILSYCLEAGFFNRRGKVVMYPFLVFGTGVLANELLLAIQGLEILFKTNNPIYNWLLWGGAILLFAGAVLLVVAFFRCRNDHKKVAAMAATFS